MIPKDPVMLLSYMNTQLRDCYNNLEDCCKSLNIEMNYVINRLKEIDYEYDKSTNQFI